MTGLIVLIAGLLAVVSQRYTAQWDWTAGGHNTLSEATRTLLERLDGPVTVTAYARDNDLLRHPIGDLIARYQRIKPDFELRFVNPDTAPQEIRQLGITVDGELLIRYQGRSDKIQQMSEQALTNTLQGLSRADERWIVFLEGHGERRPGGRANHDLGNFGAELGRKGLKVRGLNLAKEDNIPDNTAVLVIAGPQTPLLPGEQKIVQDYVEQEGNLLWLTDPGPTQGLDGLAAMLGVEVLKGRMVDPTTQLFGIDRPDFLLVPDYPPHPVTRNLATFTLYPEVAALTLQAPDGWLGGPLLESLPRAWSETGAMQGEVIMETDQGDRPGPLPLAVALTRDGKAGAGEQRVAVFGDGDFLSNAYLGNGANLTLGLNLINWLSRDDQLISIPPKTAPDTRLELSGGTLTAISAGFLLVLPIGLLGTGLLIWLRRRKR